MNATVLLIATLLAGASGPGSAPDERRLFQDERQGKRLELVSVVRPETTPPIQGTLELVENGTRRTVADQIGAAVFAPDGSILAIRRGALVRLGEKPRILVASGLAPELAIDPTGTRVALVRRLPRGGTAIDVLELEGDGRPRPVVAGGGYNNAPAFSPDGRTLVFVSSRTGLASVFRVGIDGRGERQLTNRGLERIGPGFVAPPEERGALRFEGRRLTWAASGARWFADLETAVSGKLSDGGAR